jgi:hypothetical protein
VGALAEGYVSITPLHLDLTTYLMMETIQEWNLPNKSVNTSREKLSIYQTLTTP